jgi:hypothetical protein
MMPNPEENRVAVEVRGVDRGGVRELVMAEHNIAWRAQQLARFGQRDFRHSRAHRLRTAFDEARFDQPV